jgi:hypothetical protein
MSRSKNLSDADVTKIVEILDGWSSRLSWEALLGKVESELHFRYTRQTLHAHAEIADAFALSKGRLRGDLSVQRSTLDPQLQASLEYIDRLKAENARLALQNDRLTEKFVRWAYNAHLRGMSEGELDETLPIKRQGQTKLRRA